MGPTPVHRGILYPARLPTFHREPAGDDLAAFVRWFWIPEWDLEPGRTSRQQTISFPACNLVVENALVGLAGPTTKSTHRDLTGRGWAVGALLRPAAVPAFTPDPAAIRDSYQPLDFPDLHAAVSAVMDGDGSAEVRRRQAVSVYSGWLRERLGEPADDGVLANRMVVEVEGDSTLLTVPELAARLHVSVRTVQRLAGKYVGLPPAALIRRRRLQEAAERLRLDPGVDLAAVAHELGYADHAHLSADFRTVLGFTPSTYRRDANEAEQ